MRTTTFFADMALNAHYDFLADTALNAHYDFLADIAFPHYDLLIRMAWRTTTVWRYGVSGQKVQKRVYVDKNDGSSSDIFRQECPPFAWICDAHQRGTFAPQNSATWNLVFVGVHTLCPYACPPPSHYPAHALRCPSQSGDLKVKCPSNRTLKCKGPLIRKHHSSSQFLSGCRILYVENGAISRASLFLHKWTSGVTKPRCPLLPWIECF